MKGGVGAVSPELLDATSVIGTPQQIVAKLDQWVTAGVDEPLLGIPDGTPDEAGQKLATLMQALKA
jgi:alkanesulfonate monooxygenase SsuD/methylene tetrahydromethanopterin reductase-like flavin-dependent oxidoreductase (luciferase family)